MEHVTRRGFMGAMGLASAAALAGTSVALADNQSVGIPAEKAQGVIDMVTPPEREITGESTMSLDELNRRRKELVDSRTEDWVCEDGTVIPNVYVKLRTLVHTYGIGIGNEMTDTCFDFWKRYFSEEEAQVYLEMPWGKFFTALDLSATTGRDLEYCKQVLADLASRGVLFPMTEGGNQFYRQIAFLQGSCESTLCDLTTDPVNYLMAMKAATTDTTGDRFMYNGTSFYYAIPCDRSVVSSGEIDPYDDWEAIINSKENFALAPCYCKTSAAVASGQVIPEWNSDEWDEVTSDFSGFPLRTCLLMGAEADFFVELGTAKPVTKEEALDLIRRRADEGFIIESYYSKTTEVLCSCHVKDCGHLKFHKSIPVETYANSNERPNTSHFELVYDKEACIQCGACVDRCPMESVTLDEEGYPQVDAHCFRCGQCAMTCPVGARSLAAKPKAEWGYLPYSILDDDNNKAAYRFEHGLIW